MAGKRKRTSAVEAAVASTDIVMPPPAPEAVPMASAPARSQGAKAAKVHSDPPLLSNGLHVTGPPAPEIKAEMPPDSPLSDAPEVAAPALPKAAKKKALSKDDPAVPVKTEEDLEALHEHEGDGEEKADEEEVKQALARPPPVNSDYLPLPWKGRLGYACLNTYLRYSNPPVFSSRTCRIASILEHRYPLADPSQPEHATKNRPDPKKPMDVKLGEKYLQDICLANVRDIPKMIRWNEKYGIRFLRLSSEMFPFASHEEYGYKLASFAAQDLEDAGKVIAQYGHRVTTHPGQFTQLGSPRKQVTDNAIRDLTYHDEMLSLLKLPEQQNRDAVMILHLGGVFGDKPATLDRFREVYQTLSPSIKNRLVLENDDVSYSVHELLPLCEELNIPMVLDFHHHNIIFDETQIREGTKDIVDLFPRIIATWRRKGITPKMHYSEPCPGAITGRQRRKHRPRVATLPPCPDDMDLMIEAKDKEQAVFELMKTFKLPGHDRIHEMIPYTRSDDNKLALQELDKRKRQLTTKKTKAAKKGEELDEDEADIKVDLIPDDEVGMGGPEGRVYWPPEMEEWLRPKKREVKPRPTGPVTPAKAKLAAAAAMAGSASTAGKRSVKDEPESEIEPSSSSESDVNATPATKKAKAMLKQRAKAAAAKTKQAAKAAAAATVAVPADEEEPATAGAKNTKKAMTKRTTATKGGKKAAPSSAKKVKKEILTPSTSSAEDVNEDMDYGSDGGSVAEEEEPTPGKKRVAPIAERPAAGRRQSGRAKKGVSYAEDGEMDLD